MIKKRPSKYSFLIFLVDLYRRMILIQQFFYGIFIRVTRPKNNPIVFCLGFSKTGTTSLHKALYILGYRSIHWPRAHLEPRKGWIEYIKSSHYDAFSDAPIYFSDFYKKLDKEFPGSKFILTTRNPLDLVRSWENYFMNAPWSIDNEEDKQQLIKEYNIHQKDVIEYFKERPSQFLILDVIGGEGWEKLCKFLQKPIPNISFPHKRIAKYKMKNIS